MLECKSLLLNAHHTHRDVLVVYMVYIFLYSVNFYMYKFYNGNKSTIHFWNGNICFFYSIKERQCIINNSTTSIFTMSQTSKAKKIVLQLSLWFSSYVENITHRYKFRTQFFTYAVGICFFLGGLKMNHQLVAHQIFKALSNSNY